ncbi:MAG: hypothetical protein RJA09_1422, partial [Pseudomonadota bacterium]
HATHTQQALQQHSFVHVNLRI